MALAALKTHLQGPQFKFDAQWSSLLGPLPDVAASPAETCQAAALAEKGDAKTRGLLQGQHAVTWVPEQTTPTARLLQPLLRRARSSARPQSLVMVAELPLYPGVSTVSQIMGSLEFATAP